MKTSTRKPAPTPATADPPEVLYTISWPGHGRYLLTTAQRAVVRELLAAHLAGRPDVDAASLLLAALFADSPAWGTLVLPGRKRGRYRIAEPMRGPDGPPDG